MAAAGKGLKVATIVMETKRVYFLIQEWEHPASRYRVLQYLPYLNEAHIAYTVSLFPGSFWQWMKLFSQMNGYDVLYIQKKRLWHWQLWYLKRKCIKIIYDFDDAVMYKSPVDGRRRSFKRQRTFARMVRFADSVIAGNSYLKSKALPYNNNVTIIPTAVDTGKYSVRNYDTRKEKITIGWIGSKSSLPFIQELTPAFDKLAEQNKSLELKIICNEFIDCKTMPVHKKIWAIEDENADLQGIDIGLAPLPNHEWTRGKCATKLLQYFAVGVPVVCSPVGVHSEIVEEGVNGMFASTVDEWAEKIKSLADDAALRRRMGLAGRKTLDAGYSLQANAPKFINVIRGV
ncbi:glycosyltransferase family 4 protein [uncultured Candidatus Kuenenia sp.]|uniref:glycosyltransferase family 4 protein n=1 Tax=uncultured Candidatus Kuenenia sp. TaxID=1048336 RepID=UPI0025E1CE6B|nr:glycosyltransferase family 4 protein [uncultured Candidatus Kuenenia sp.]